MINKTQVHKILTIDDIHKETIYGVIGRMEVLLEYFEKNPKFHSLTPFLKTYYLVTKASSEKYIAYKHYFHNIRDHELLDIYFATLYFKPLLYYLQTGKALSPWKHYYSYCKKPDGLPFLQMLIGINVHINADLYASLVYLPYKHKNDFFLVNQILEEVLPAVLHFLAFSKHDVIGVSGLFLKGFILAEFHKVIERWRMEAWVNASKTNNINKAAYLRSITKSTEAISEQLIDELHHLYAINKISQAPSLINTLSVKLP
jgi:hypothetical protein